MWNAWMANWDQSEIDLWTLSAQSRTWIDLRSLSSWIRVLVWMAHRHQFIPSKCCPVCDVKPTSRLSALINADDHRKVTNKQTIRFVCCVSIGDGRSRSSMKFYNTFSKNVGKPSPPTVVAHMMRTRHYDDKILLILLAIAPNFTVSRIIKRSFFRQQCALSKTLQI